MQRKVAAKQVQQTLYTSPLRMLGNSFRVFHIPDIIQITAMSNEHNSNKWLN